MKKLKQAILPFYLAWLKIYTLYINPYKYDKNRYKDSFVSNKDKVSHATLSSAEEILYILWTGDNEIPENRKIGIHSIKQKAGVEVKLITPENLNDYIIQDFPLHPAYHYLSYIQKSDYLRCYLMLHHGGGYSDIKPCLNSWKELFVKLNNSNKWAISKRERYAGGVAPIGGNIGADCYKYHNNLISNSAFIYKPGSPIAVEWMDEIHSRLDYFFEDLKENPGDAFGSGNYPIPWAYLAGHIMAPLILKYHEHIICEDIPLFDLNNYR